MALNDAQFIQQAVDLQTKMEAKTDRDAAKQDYAVQLLKLVKDYLKSASIEITGTSNQGPFTGTAKIT
ncbi:Uncharacterised protein [Chryseobacterium nakagawai]|uniref:Uncharacterized protein n=1 Tax=Chryseobacterium nakagawai TaxID=1241982 RepID=A0AAD0YPI0_CHRNA|nr:hypothetical protein [Chryseobacterium nakagawai]AZA90916.1 hypothetical protein EG343_09855 [Chryseobacterium nakagawai]VEH22454.1 Uncharacterised protein [Chryseobacterium nakagawai]